MTVSPTAKVVVMNGVTVGYRNRHCPKDNIEGERRCPFSVRPPFTAWSLCSHGVSCVYVVCVVLCMFYVYCVSVCVVLCCVCGLCVCVSCSGAVFGPGCLLSTLLGKAAGGAGRLLPAAVDCFRLTHCRVDSCSCYQLPLAVVAIAEAVQWVIGRGRGPVVLVGYSLSGAAMLEAAGRLLGTLPAGWLAGIVTCGSQSAGLHCDNPANINTLQGACRRVARAGP